MKIKIAFLVAAFILAAPQASHAYNTTGQAAFRINDNLALYAIEFELGHSSHDMYLPTTITRGGTGKDELGIDLLAASEEVTDYGGLLGVVRGNVEKEDGYYYIPAGSKATFTIFGILVYVYDPETTVEDDYAMGVTHLPFYFDAERIKNGLNKTELQHYVTPALDLGENAVIKGSVMRLVTKKDE